MEKEDEEESISNITSVERNIFFTNDIRTPSSIIYLVSGFDK